MAKYLSERLAEPWIAEALIARADFLDQRIAKREATGAGASHDRTERDAIRRILASKPDPEIFRLRDEITLLSEKLTRQRTAIRELEARNLQLEEALIAAGIKIPETPLTSR